MSSTPPATYVQLDRRFIPWTDENATIETATLWERTIRGRLDWPALLEHQRVVVLAEAGSGKSDELEEQARALSAAGKRVFHTTVQDLARNGLAGALTNQKRAELEAWRSSNDRAYFFIDSIDEAKYDAIRIETAFNKLRDGVDGGLPRATIILSGRYTDWEFQSDLSRLESMLPITPQSQETSLPPTEILAKILNNEWNGRQATAPEKPLVVLMASLDEGQVRTFIKARRITDVEAFIAALGQENLWKFAHRPLDLEWLAEYWQSHRSFGTLAQMLSASITQRLKETNPNLARRDPLPEAKSLEALERVGAAMVFGRTDRILIPDRVAAGGPDEFKLENILPDWSEEHRNRLRARPVFDAATFGRIQLHNDNDGDVRGYLAARWLKRRKDGGCPVRYIYELLFAETYGFELVKPSVRQTAAWLSIWDEDVARKVVATDPALLLRAGDPGSLPPGTRINALCALVDQIAREDEWYGWLDWSSLRRFSGVELVPTLKELWARHATRHVRQLLLQLMVAADLDDCLDIACAVSLGGETDRVSRVLAARLLVKFADTETLARYALLICSSPRSHPVEELDEAMVALFPAYVSVDQLLSVLAVRNSEEAAHGSLETIGPQLAERLSKPSDLERLIEGLLDQLTPAEEDGEDEAPDEKAYFPILQSAVTRLLAAVSHDEIPEIAVDATIRLGAHRLYRPNSLDLSAIYKALHATPERRRHGMWAAFGKVDRSRFMQNQAVANPAQLGMLGWPVDLRPEDIPWLLQDAIKRPTEDERKFALVCALIIWRDLGKPEAGLASIEPVARSEPALSAILDDWLAPPETADWEIRHNKEMKRLRARNAKREARRNKSWMKFVADLQADPEYLRHLQPRSDNNVDGRLFYFYELLSAVSRGNSRYQIDDVSPLEPVFGEAVVAAGREGLIRYWRHHKPAVVSEKGAEGRNSISKLDCMGIVGISLEAMSDPAWVARLSSEEAERAAEYATLELNGFPTWFGSLVELKPTEVRTVFLREIAFELAPDSGDSHGILQDISYASAETAQLVAPAMLDEMRRHPSVSDKALDTAVSILTKGLATPEDRDALLGLALQRFKIEKSASACASYLYAAFHVDAVAATTALIDRLETLPPSAQTEFCKKILPRIFGDRLFRGGIDPSLVPFSILERLVRIAYRTIRLEDDHDHKAGEVYSMDDRHYAEGARSSLFNRLADTPGPATVEALRRVGPIIGLEEDRVEQLVFNRAANDSEAGRWPASQAYEMEGDFDVAPQSPADLQKIALGRFLDIDHDAHTSDFAQGLTLKGLDGETPVQIWVGNELQSRRRRGYSTERESEVVGNNRPDIRLRSGEISLPVEVKVAETWSLRQLEQALTEQLEGRYLRHQDARHGVLLLVHQKAKPQGWKGPDGRYLTFPEVVSHLRALASQRACVSHESPKAALAIIDVSDIVPPEKPHSRKTI